MQKNSLIYVAGHTGLVGSALVRKLKDAGYSNLLLRTHRQLDLTNQKAVQSFFAKNKPQFVFMPAGKVGGIEANRTQPAQFLYENMQMAANVLHSAYLTKVKKLLYVSTSCIYPRNCPQPIKEKYLFTGPLEETNYGYAVAKITGLKMCQAYQEQYKCNFIVAVPNNVYGPKKRHDIKQAHVIPALIEKFTQAQKNCSKQIVLWGTGSPRREFLHCDDLAEALIFLMQRYNQKDHINVGPGQDYSIKELAKIIKEITGFNGKIIWDTKKPNGMPKKALDVSKINRLGWKAKIDLRVGLEQLF